MSIALPFFFLFTNHHGMRRKRFDMMMLYPRRTTVFINWAGQHSLRILGGRPGPGRAATNSESAATFLGPMFLALHCSGSSRMQTKPPGPQCKANTTYCMCLSSPLILHLDMCLSSPLVRPFRIIVKYSLILPLDTCLSSPLVRAL